MSLVNTTLGLSIFFFLLTISMAILIPNLPQTVTKQVDVTTITHDYVLNKVFTEKHLTTTIDADNRLLATTLWAVGFISFWSFLINLGICLWAKNNEE